MYIIQHDYRDDIALMNRWNIEDRHCKIVNVRRKGLWPFRPPTQPPLDAYRLRKPLTDAADPCAGCWGKACGSVACPRRLQVTC